MSGALTKYMPPIVLPIVDADPEPEVPSLRAALAVLQAGNMVNGHVVHLHSHERLQARNVFYGGGQVANSFDTSTYVVGKDCTFGSLERKAAVKSLTRFAGGGVASCYEPATYVGAKDFLRGSFVQNSAVKMVNPGGKFAGGHGWTSLHDLDIFFSTNCQVVGVGELWLTGSEPWEMFDSDMLRSILVNVARSDRYEAPIAHNARATTVVDLMPRTTDVTTEFDVREVAILESRQQRDAILTALDFRAAIETLMDEEQFSSHDLTQLIGVTRAVLSTWRDRPLEKIRMVNHASLGRLLFGWKYWLHVTEGELLGRYLRHVPEQCATSLLRLLADHEPTDDEIARHIDRLAVYAAIDRKAAAVRRRDLGGLPSSVYQPDLFSD
jgi:hypothetical protein